MGKIGYGSITLTDITESLPISLVLETNLDQNIQTKVGNLYTPDFTIVGEEEGLIITPSLFIGQEEINLKEHPEYIKPEGRTTGFIYYEINQLTNNQIFYKEEPERASDLFVDEIGRLHIKINLASNILIEVYILNFEEASHGLKTELVQATNPISILFLEEGNNNYYAAIECENGREHFEERNANDIVMTAKLYQGIDDILNLNDYEIAWKKTSDGENTKLGTDKQYIVSRDAVSNRELFYCEIKDKKTGITYTAKQFIYDFQDTYRCDISYNKSLLINESNPEITLTATAWNKDKKIAEIKENGNFVFKLSYRWILLYENNNLETIEIILQEGNSNSFTLNYSDERLPKTSSFVIFCAVLNTDSKENKSVIASNAVSINYVPDYQIVISPKTIFVPTGNDGTTYNGAETYTFSFKLVDKNGETLSYDTQDETNEMAPSLVTDDGTTIDFKQEDQSKWAFDGEIKLATGEGSLWDDALLSSKAYEFSFVFFGMKMTEEINIVKSFAGEQGFSGYTVDLSPEFYAFSGGEGQATPDQVINLSASAFFGDDKLEITSLKIEGEDLLNKEITYQKLLISAKKDLSKQLINISIKTQGQGNFLTAPGNIPFLITVKTSTTKEITFIKTFNYSINYNGSSFYLHLGDGSSIVYNKPEDLYVPQSITVYAKKISENGESSDYSNGVIMYKYNTSSNWTIASRTGFCSIENYPNNFSSIEIRLYGANIVNEAEVGQNITSISTEILNKNKLSKYLRAADTIPLVTSMEGYSIGGENLLRWTKEMPIESGKWSRSGIPERVSTTIDTDGFSVLTFNVDGSGEFTTWYGLHSPTFAFSEEYMNKTFCFSCLYKKEDISTKSGLISVQGHSFANEARIGWKDFSIENAIFEEEKSNTWVKIYFTFKITEDFFKNGNEEIDINTLTYLSIGFWITGKSEKILIKKPKLELGNLPSSWSASPYDVDYNSIAGTNLGKGSYSLEIKTSDNPPYNIFAQGLKNNTYYTFSFKNSFFEKISSTDTQFICELRSYDKGKDDLDSISEATYKFSNSVENTLTTKTFQTPNNSNKYYSFRIYPKSTTTSTSVSIENTETLTLLQTKLEEGQEATSFFISEQYIQNIINTLSNNSSENTELITILQADGTEIQTTLNNLEETVNSLASSQITMDEVNASILMSTTQALTNFIETGRGSYLSLLENYIDIVTNSSIDATAPYIQLGQKTSDWENKIKLTPKKLSFMENGNEIAYFSSQKLFINQAHFNQTFSIGDLLVKITETGVGFTWNTNA